jgi:tetratricopeptide (TPR) repeat protein
MAPSLLYRDATAEVLSLLTRIDDLPLAGLVRDTSAQSTWLRLLDASDGVREAATHTRAMTLAERQNDLTRALREGELAVGLSAHDGALRARLARLYLTRAALRMRRDPGAAEEDLTAVLELSPPTTERFRALLALGDLATRRRDGQRALARYQAALAIADAARESAPEVHVRLAAALSLLGAREQANEALARAAREAPSERRRREIEALRR